MILINNEAVIQNENDLEEFIEILKGETYNDLSQKICDVISDFLREVWERDTKLTAMMHKKISRALYPVEMITLDNSADWTSLDIKVIVKSKVYREKKADIKTFNGLCDIYFKGMKPLYNRIIEIDEIKRGV